jgi:hypothetical protein
MLDYSAKPGESASAPANWPEQTQLQLAKNSYNLIMFLHPQCPCSRASVGELERLVVRSTKNIQIYVLFLQPKGYGEEWSKTDLWRSASLIPAVHPVVDREGREAQLFSVWTSGQTLLYGPDGKLKFNGGITGARGHEGDNAGETALLSLLRGGANLNQTPVFGCALSSHTDKKI